MLAKPNVEAKIESQIKSTAKSKATAKAIIAMANGKSGIKMILCTATAISAAADATLIMTSVTSLELHH